MGMFTGNHIISRSYENHSIIILLTVHRKINKQLCVIKQGNCQILWWVDRHLGKKSFEIIQSSCTYQHVPLSLNNVFLTRVCTVIEVY